MVGGRSVGKSRRGSMTKWNFGLDGAANERLFLVGRKEGR